jgi:hypothetical protein
MDFDSVSLGSIPKTCEYKKHPTRRPEYTTLSGFR